MLEKKLRMYGVHQAAPRSYWHSTGLPEQLLRYRHQACGNLNGQPPYTC